MQLFTLNTLQKHLDRDDGGNGDSPSQQHQNHVDGNENDDGAVFPDGYGKLSDNFDFVPVGGGGPSTSDETNVRAATSNGSEYPFLKKGPLVRRKKRQQTLSIDRSQMGSL